MIYIAELYIILLSPEKEELIGPKSRPLID